MARHCAIGHKIVDYVTIGTYLPLMTKNEIIDARGMLCPLPVLKLRKRLKTQDAGAVVILLADDPAAAIDVPYFCRESGHEFVEAAEADDHTVYRVRKV